MATQKLLPEDQIEQLKKWALIALFSDDDLLERLVLKGGNALAIAYGLKTRMSADLDLSMSEEFALDELDDVRNRIEARLNQTFKPEGWVPFDIKFEEMPPNLTEDLADFWGGYKLEFKLLDIETYRKLEGNLDAMQRSAQTVGPGQRRRFEVDISRHEHCVRKQAVEIDGYTVFVYEPVLLVCEKFRAICQQMPEYNEVVKRRRDGGGARPRDFLDIHTLLTRFPEINMESTETRRLLVEVFEKKRVPFALVTQIRNTFEQHVTGWRAVQDTVRTGFEIEDFQFYFDYVVDIAEMLHPRGNM